ncbi:MAG: extracellular solute-binding protein, partial [Burkholderiales bacterium]|nr:extracellular solute-binding protein [Burkholderiales bacterium]
MNDQKPVRGTTRRSFVAGAAAVLGVPAGRAFAQATETVSYDTFLDPASTKDPRSAAQTQMIAAFEVSHPRVKVRVVVDPTGQNGIRAARAKSDSPDVIRVNTFQMPEFVSTGSVLALDELIARDKVDTTDWLIGMDQTRVNGKVWGLQQDYRIPIYVYRKSKFAEAKIATPPRTYEEVGGLGRLLTKGNQMAYGIPLGLSGGIGGAQAFMEFILSSIVAGNTDPFFMPNGREIGFNDKRLLLTATIVKDLFAKKAATPVSLQFAVDGMTCGSCATRIQRVLGRQPGVLSADVNFATSTAHVVRADRLASPDELCAAVENIGYGLRPVEPGAPMPLGDEHTAAAEHAWLRRVIVGWPLALVVGYLAMLSGPVGEQPWGHWVEFV